MSEEIRSNPSWSLGQTQSPLTGYTGLAFIVICTITVSLVLASNPGIQHAQMWPLHKPVCWIAVLLSMVAIEVLVFKTHKRNFDFASGRPLDKEAWLRVMARFLALCLCFIVSAIIVVPMTFIFSAFLPFYILFLPLILICSIPYFVICEKFARADGPVDEILLLAQVILPGLAGVSAMDANLKKEHMLNLLRGMIIKSYFIPFMTASCSTYWGFWQNHILEFIANYSKLSLMPPGLLGRELFMPLFEFIIVVDLTIALLGYITSCRLLDTQFTSADPSVSGWTAALACYPPFNFVFETMLLNHCFYANNEFAFYLGQPVLLNVLSILVLILIAIYSLSTVVFGLRFSNLTNRGIITSGPYSVVRHPAYVCKNLSWWFALLPWFMTNGFNSIFAIIVLLVLNAFYVWRALTEEKHLMREEHYRQYCEKTKWRFIPGLV